MISKRTTLLLGAGASAHLGYPLGTGLRDNILSMMNPPDKRNGDLARLVGHLGSEELWRPFAEHLSRGGWRSPDAFLEKHREFIPLGKTLMAIALKQCEHPMSVFPPSNNGWYGYLGDCLLEATVDEFRKNKLSIVTFNYDRSIEFFLHNLVKYRYVLSDGEAWKIVQDTIPLVHVHGILGTYPDISYSTNGDVGDISRTIKIIHEFDDSNDGFCSKDFEQAHSLLRQSEVIYSLGFAMAETNMERLRFFGPQAFKERTIKCAIGPVHGRQRASFCSSVEKYGFGPNDIISGVAYEFFSHHFAFE